MAAIDVQVTASPTVEITHPNVIIGTCDDATVENSDASYSTTVASGATLVLPDTSISTNGDLVINQPSTIAKDVVVRYQTQGTASTTISGGEVVVPDVPYDLDLLIPVTTGDNSASFTVVSNSAGTIDTITSTGLTTFAITVNAVGVSVPFSVVATDVVAMTFDAAASDVTVTLSGTYTP